MGEVEIYGLIELHKRISDATIILLRISSGRSRSFDFAEIYHSYSERYENLI